MSGWPSVAIIFVAQIAAAAFLIRLGARRWWDYLVLSALTIALLRPTAEYVTGDVSRYLPDAVWSAPGEKDQIVFASAASTILLPVMASGFIVYVFNRAWRALQGVHTRRGG